MIELYGKLYAPQGANDLDRSVTINGTYRKEGRWVLLIDTAGKERAAIQKDGFGPVSVGTASEGRRFYMNSTSTIEEEWLGTPDSFFAEIEGAKELARQLYTPNQMDAPARYARSLALSPICGGIPRPAWSQMTEAAKARWQVSP
jgi:hypothetical protein